MPWQGQLYVGVPVKDYAEVRAAFAQLGLALTEPAGSEAEVEEAEDAYVEKTLSLGGEDVGVGILFSREHEGGAVFPLDTKDAHPDYTDALVGFPLTSRYAPGILNRAGSRPEPFAIDIVEVLSLLEQVNAFWPQARLLIWTVFY